MLYRECEVRVCQARHLTARNSIEQTNSRDKKTHVTGLCALISHGGRHVPTEVCRDIENPYWQKIASFPLLMRDSVEEPGGCPEKSSATNRLAEVAVEETKHEVMQSLNPFAKNFVPPESLPAQPPPPPSPPTPPSSPPPPSLADGHLRTSLIIHFHLLGENLISRELIGDVAVDLVPILETADKKVTLLETDRLAHVEDNFELAGLPANASVATDTWIALRQRNGELRIQVLIKPVSSVSDLGGRQGIPLSSAPEVRPIPRAASSANFRSRSNPFGMDRATSLQPRRNSDEEVPCHPQDVDQQIASRRGAPPYSAEMSGRSDRGSKGARGPPRGYVRDTRVGLWPEFDRIAKDGLVKVSVSSAHGSLDERLLEVQEQYDFSAARGYREGKPDQDAGEGMRAVAREASGIPEWPTSVFDAAQLRRDMQLATLRNKRQCIGEVSRNHQLVTIKARIIPTALVRPYIMGTCFYEVVS